MHNNVVVSILFTIIFISIILGFNYLFIVRQMRNGTKRFFKPVHCKQRDEQSGEKVHVLRHNLSQQFTISKYQSLAVNQHDRYYLELLYLYSKAELEQLSQAVTITLELEHNHSVKSLELVMEPYDGGGVMTYFGSRKFNLLKFLLLGTSAMTSKPRLIGRAPLTLQQMELISLANSVIIRSAQLALLGLKAEAVAKQQGVRIDDHYFGSFKHHLPQLI